MKNLPFNEKQLADKLQNVPVPDVDQSWEQMRRLLEREMPEPVGAWSGNKKWWWMGIAAAVIMIGAFLANPFHNNTAETKAVAGASVSDNKNVSAGKTNATTKTITTAKNNSITKANPTENAKSGNNNSPKPEMPSNLKKAIVVENKSIESSLKQKPLAALKNNFAFNQKPTKQKTNYLTRNQKPPKQKNNDDEIIMLANISSSSRETEPSFINTELANTGNLNNPGDLFNETLPSHLSAISGKTDKAFAREMRTKSMKADNRRLSRSAMRGGPKDNDHEITFAAGLVLPQSLAVSGQQSASYNIAAKTNRITDYLPAPFFQYHLNEKLFLQTEFHFQSPQFTQRLLLSQTSSTVGNTRIENTEHLEKLYYFNIPFNAYFSPARNVYIGGGLQYSSLLGGVSTFENKRTEGQNVVSYTSETRRFNDDTSAMRFSPSEWRYQLDANYYWNRFSFGMRYNRALKDYITISPDPSLPLTKGRNSSFLLYVRFNIWEERKKEAN